MLHIIFLFVNWPPWIVWTTWKWYNDSKSLRSAFKTVKTFKKLALWCIIFTIFIFYKSGNTSKICPKNYSYWPLQTLSHMPGKCISDVPYFKFSWGRTPIPPWAISLTIVLVYNNSHCLPTCHTGWPKTVCYFFYYYNHFCHVQPQSNVSLKEVLSSHKTSLIVA